VLDERLEALVGGEGNEQDLGWGDRWREREDLLSY
jgi:hypothetical protein